MIGTRRIRIEKLREHQYREGYARSLEGKGVEWDGYNNVDCMWEQVKQAMVEIARELRVGGKNPKSVWWNDEIKAAVKRKEVLVASNEESKERYIYIQRREEKG